jgi:hypothetical protein
MVPMKLNGLTLDLVWKGISVERYYTGLFEIVEHKEFDYKDHRCRSSWIVATKRNENMTAG